MRIATYNVNGIKARLPRLVEWLAETQPDIVCLQEIKSTDDTVPAEAIRDAGYGAIWHGQKGFNGVAVLARGQDPEHLSHGLPGDQGDDQSRWLEARVGRINVVALYLPNGNPRPGPKFDYKLAWMDRMRARAATLMASEQPWVLAGDYNVIPNNDDVWSPSAMAEDALMQPAARDRYAAMLAAGWTDAVRALHPAGGLWTYWDYQAGALARNHGFRIDHLLLTPDLADRMAGVGVDKDHRMREKASDHAATWVELAD